MLLLPHDRIMRLQEAAISGGLPRSRDALLGGIHPELTAGLPSAADPSGQILCDLHALNTVSRLEDGSVPLRIWLENAARLSAPRVEASVFREALALLDRPLVHAAGTAIERLPPQKTGLASTLMGVVWSSFVDLVSPFRRR